MPIDGIQAVDAPPAIPNNSRGDQFTLFHDRCDVFDMMKMVGGILVSVTLVYCVMYVCLIFTFITKH